MNRFDSVSLRALAALALAAACPTLALQGGAIMPEYVQFEPADAPDMVNLNTGDFSYTIPLGEVPGPYGSYPISMSYHPGIGPNAEATWVGLGWTLNTGAINRNLRGAPDDQFHGGELAFLYSYAKSSNWGVSTGYSYGAFSVNTTYNTASGYGLSVGYGLQLGCFQLGASYGMNGVSLDAGVGVKGTGLGVQGSISVGPDGYQGSSIGVSVNGAAGDGGTVSASVGVHHTAGRGMSAEAGVGYTPKHPTGDNLTSSQKREATYARSKSSALHFSDGNVSVKGAGFGTSISMPGSGIGVASSNGATSSKASMTGVVAVLPTPIGIFSFGYSRSINETWMRQATTEYLYGYMYQAGPAIFKDGKTEEMNIGGTSGSGASSAWSWNFKGKTMDRVGNPTNGDMLPAYDLFGVAANGLAGTFRAYGMNKHSIFESIELLDDDDQSAQSVYYLLQEDAANKKQHETEFPASPNTAAGSADFSKYAYDYCYDQATLAATYNTGDNVSKLNEVIAGRCSRYAILTSRHLNEGNRLVLSTDSNNTSNIRSRMIFKFMGEGGGYFRSEEPNRKSTKYGQYELDPALFQKTVNTTNYGLFGGRRIDPILEDGKNNGRLKGFKITNADGTQFFFTQPVRAIISADYTTNMAKGAPLFVDKYSPGADDNFLDVIANAFESAYEFGGKLITNPIDAFADLTGWAWNINQFPFKSVSAFLWSSPKFTDKCETGPDEQYNFSYSMKVNPYATQWLLTEVRGPDFVLLDKVNMEKNIGYQVRFGYTTPTWYKWRFPFAPPGTIKSELPNFRLPKNAKTPANCHSDMYHGSFGVKELVYLSSIETSSHKALFQLNDKDNPRQDGKGWIQDWTGRSNDVGANKSTAMPIYLDVQMEMGGTAVASQAWVKKCRLETALSGTTTVNIGRTCWWERNLNYAIDGAYLNVIPTQTQIDRMIGKKLAIAGMNGGSSLAYAPPFTHTTKDLPAGHVFTGLPKTNLANADLSVPVVSGIASATGVKMSLGSSRVAFVSPILAPVSPYSTNEVTDNYRNVYRVGMNSCPTTTCDPFATTYNPPMPTPPADNSIPASTTIGGAASGIKKPKILQPLLVYNDFVETTGDDDNVMRRLESIKVIDKANSIALRKYNFNYDYEITPGTLNSYDVPRDANGKAIRTDGKLDLASGYPKSDNPTLEELGGKLKLQSVQEMACLNLACDDSVPMPPFKFYYKNETDSPLKHGQDFYGTIIASSNPQDEWGMWNKFATEDNKKVRQDFATYGAVSWSMDKVVDPAGGVLEVEYERDTYKGESYSDDTKDFQISWRKCPATGGTPSTPAMDPTHLCIDVLPRRWTQFCNRNDQLVGQYTWQPNLPTSAADYTYIAELYSAPNTPIIDKQVYFQLDASYKFEVGCGAGLGSWKASSCDRHRSVGALGSGRVKSIKTFTGVPVKFIDGDAPELRTIELDVSYDLVQETLHKAGYALTDRSTNTSITPLKGMFWIQKQRTDLKGGDLRVAKLIRKDIGLTQTTKYDYAIGEMAQYPDSVLSTAFAERFSPVKSMTVLPLTYLPSISRVPGVSDDDLSYLPASTITYPKVTVTNTTADGSTILNGKTVYEYITPEAGVPQREGAPAPFMKLKVSMTRLLNGNSPKTWSDLIVTFKDASNTFLGSSIMTRLPPPADSVFVYESVSTSAYFKTAHTMEFSYTPPGTTTPIVDIVKLSETGNPINYEVFNEYADVNVSVLLNVRKTPTVLLASLTDFKSSKLPPILVRTTPMESISRSYADYTSFLGKQTNTEYYRWMPPTPGTVNNANNPAHQDPARYKLIKADSVAYSSVVPSADDRFYTDAQTNRLKIGQDEEKWEYMRKIHCDNSTIVNSSYGIACTDAKYKSYEDLELTVDANKNYAPRQMSYVRFPAYVVETVSKSGFNGTLNAEEYIVTRVTNHRFDPITGVPTLSATFTGRAGQYVPAKAARTTPAYTVNTALAATMFERNMFQPTLREDAFTWMNAATATDEKTGAFINFDTDDPNSATLFAPRRTQVKLTPFSQAFVDFAGTAGAPKPILARDNPILTMGTYTPRFKLTDATGQSELSNNAALFTPNLGTATFLQKWNGTRITKVSRQMHPVEEANVYGTMVAKRYDPTGFHQIAVYGNAAYAETALLTAESRNGTFPDVSLADEWRFTGGSPVKEKNFIKLTNNFTLSHAVELTGGAGYLVEMQIHSSVARTCQVSFYTDAGGAGTPTPLALTQGLNAYQVSLSSTAGYTSPPLPGTNRMRLACTDGVAGTSRVAYLRAYPEKAETVSYIYDDRGSMTQSVNEQNVSSYYEYDAFGNLASIRNDDGVLFTTHKRELTNVDR